MIRVLRVMSVLFAVAVLTVLWGSTKNLVPPIGSGYVLGLTDMRQIHGMTGCPSVALGPNTQSCQTNGIDCNGTYPNCGTCIGPCAENDSLTSGMGNPDATGYFASKPCPGKYYVNSCTPWQILDPDNPSWGCSCDDGTPLTPQPCGGSYTGLNGC